MACLGCGECLRLEGPPERIPIFDLGQQVPFDVPTQVRRAESLIASLRPLKGKRILVVGGGAAGVSAAMAALNEDVAAVVVIERNHQPLSGPEHDALFSLLRSPRDLDGELYSWPDTAPPPSSGTLLPFKGAPGFIVATTWIRRLKDHPRIDRLLVYPGVDLGRPGSDSPFRLELGSEAVRYVSPVGEERFDLAIISTGSRIERRSVGHFEGFGFWDSDDPLTSAIADGDKPWVNAKQRVLISGGGNGGQQDFIQAMCGLCVRDVLRELALPGPVVDAASALHAKHSNRGTSIADISRDWREFARKIVDNDAAIHARVETLIANRASFVRFQHSGDEFDRSFPLNQVLSRIIEYVADGMTVHPSTQLSSVQCLGSCDPAHFGPLGHIPDPDHPDRSHHVNNDASIGEWELVYVRHGAPVQEWWRKIRGVC